MFYEIGEDVRHDHGRVTVVHGHDELGQRGDSFGMTYSFHDHRVSRLPYDLIQDALNECAPAGCNEQATDVL